MLPYGYGDLEPHIDEETMHFHHDKHHQTYLDKLNAAISSYEELDGVAIETILRDVSQIPEPIKKAVINNGGGFVNHNIYFSNMSPDGGGEPSGLVNELLRENFGSIADFRTKFTETALNTFGSGWVWLVFKDNKLHIVSRPNQDSPSMDGFVPLLGLDVWEHAYYLKHKNKRADYVESWWNVVNWNDVKIRYEGN